MTLAHIVQQCGEGDGSMELHPAAAGVPRRERQPVRIVEDCTPDHFKREIAQTREPALLRGLPLGPCLDLWTPEHLMRQGGTKEVRTPHLKVLPCPCLASL